MIQSLGKDGTKSVSFTVAKSDMLRVLDLLNENKDYLGIKKLDSDENVAKVLSSVPVFVLIQVLCEDVRCTRKY